MHKMHGLTALKRAPSSNQYKALHYITKRNVTRRAGFQIPNTTWETVQRGLHSRPRSSGGCATPLVQRAQEQPLIASLARHPWERRAAGQAPPMSRRHGPNGKSPEFPEIFWVGLSWRWASNRDEGSCRRPSSSVASPTMLSPQLAASTVSVWTIQERRYLLARERGRSRHKI